MKRIPSKIEIIHADCILFDLVLVMFALSLFVIVTLFHKHYPFNDMNVYKYLEFFVYPIASSCLIPYVYFRSMRIQNLFRDGVEIIANVVNMEKESFPWFGVKYEFICEGKMYKKMITLVHTKNTKTIVEKQEFIVMVDPISKRSYIRDAFKSQTGEQ